MAEQSTLRESLWEPTLMQDMDWVYVVRETYVHPTHGPRIAYVKQAVIAEIYDDPRLREQIEHRLNAELDRFIERETSKANLAPVPFVHPQGELDLTTKEENDRPLIDGPDPYARYGGSPAAA